MADEPRNDALWETLEGLVVDWQSAATDERRALADKLAETRERFDLLLGDVKGRQENDAERARAALTSLKSLRKSLSDADKLRSEVAEAESVAAQRGQELERLRDDLLKTQKALAERTDAAQAAQQRIDDLTQAESRTSEALRASEAKSSELEHALSEARRATGDVKERTTALEGRLATAGDTAKQYEKQLEDTRAELRNVQASLQERETAIARLEETLKERNEAVEAAQTQSANLQQLAATETVRVRDAERRAGSAEGSLETAKEEIASLRSELEAGKKHHAESRDRIEGLGAELRQAVSARDAAQAEADRLRRQLEASHRAADDAQEAKRLLDIEHERAELLNDRLQQETARGTKSALAEQLAQALKDNDETRQELFRLRQEMRRKPHNGKSEQHRPAGPVEVSEEALAVSADHSETSIAETDSMSGNEGPRTPLGESLLQAGTVTRGQLARALDEQRKSPGRRLESILVERGFAEEVDVASALAGLSGSEVVHVGGTDVSSDVANLITGRLAALHVCIPLRATEDTLTLAMANPLDLIAIEDVERASQRRVEPVVAPASEIRAAIQQAY